MNNVKELFKINVFYGTFLFKRLILVVVMVMSFNLLSPVITSIYGKNLDITAISLFSIIVTSVGILQVLVRKVSIKYTSLCVIISHFILLLGLLVYALGLVNDMFLIYVLLFTTSLEALIGSAYINKISNILSKLYPNEYEEFLFSKGALISISGLLGLTISATTSYLGGTICTAIVVIIALSISIILGYTQIKDLVRMEKEVNAMIDEK